MTSDVEAVRAVLRALADVRNGEFQRLLREFEKLGLRPDLWSRLSRLANDRGASLGLGISAERDDGVEVNFSIVCLVDDTLTVTAQVELTDTEGRWSEAFAVSEETNSSTAASELIHNFASDLRDQVNWLEAGSSA
jgi:hypothetical protein